MKDQRGARVKDQILDVRDLHTHFKTLDGLVKAVGGVSFSIPAGASVGIVGESGSGKSVTSLSMMRLIEPPGYIARGQLVFKGRELIASGRECPRSGSFGFSTGEIDWRRTTATEPTRTQTRRGHGDALVRELQNHCN